MLNDSFFKFNKKKRKKYDFFDLKKFSSISNFLFYFETKTTLIVLLA